MKRTSVSVRRFLLAASMRGSLVVAMLGLGVLASGCGSAAGGSTTAATSAPTATRTSATATPATGIQDATLGGTLAGFNATYSPEGDGVPGHFQGIISGTPFFVIVLTTVDAAKGHANHLRLVPQDSGVKWSAATGSQIATAFLPKDAKHLKDVTVSGSGLEHLYVSAALAGTFPADQFI